jgi:serine/threonine protein kinase
MSESFPFLPTHAALMPLPEANDALPVGTHLGEFEIREVVGVGGFGIVYRAWEPSLEREVALKEYMPMGLVSRGPDGHVALRSRGHEEDFLLGLKSFVNEARLLARFDHPALVKVHRFLNMNGTAYMAMPFYRAQTLRQRRQALGLQPPTQAWLLSMIEPLLGALAEMHRADVYHRDIAPDNILWCEDNRPVLLDFGAARHVLTDRTQALTAILKPQFAPIEQYADAKSMRQGPWTDIFALASTCYFMLTGRPPLPATARVLSDELTPLAELAPPGFSLQVLATLDWAMCVRPDDRPQSVATFWDALHGHLRVPMRTTPRPAARARRPADAGPFERTIQASARPEDAPPSGFARLRATMADAAGEHPDLRAMAAGVGRRTWLALGAAALALVAAAWLAPWHAQPASGNDVTPPLSAASAPASAVAPVTAASEARPPVTEARTPAAPSAAARAHEQALQADIAWAAAHEASAPAASRAGATASASAARRAGPREACRASDASDVNACIQRLCKSDPRFKRDKSCVAPAAPARHWWQFGKSD